jgi:hypothetical protein
VTPGVLDEQEGVGLAIGIDEKDDVSASIPDALVALVPDVVRSPQDVGT